MVSDFQAYRFYLAIKTHFTKENFDVFEHKGTKCSEKTFLERNDHRLFQMISRKFEDPREIIQFFVSNISIGVFDFLYNLEVALENYKRWKSYKESFSYKFSVDLSVIGRYMEKNKCDFPEAAWKCYLEGNINIQSIHIINELEDIFQKFGSSTLLLHKEEILRIRKCKGFVKIPDGVKNIFNEKRKELVN